MLLRVGALMVALAVPVAGVHAQIAAPGAPPAAVPATNPVCTRLEAQLAAVDRGSADPARAEQVRRYEDAAGRQQAELDRVVAQSRQMGCDSGGFLSLFTSRPEQCGPLSRQIQQMRANLDRMLADLERLRGNSADRENQRRTVVAALAQNDCGPQYRAAVAATQQGGGFLGGLFSGGESNAIIAPEEAQPQAPSSTFRTVCVRTCDGFYFPISYATSPSRFADDERVCQRMCPNAEVILFSHRNPGEDINQAVSITGQNYTQLPNAFRYRTAFDKSCSCRKPGQTWAEALEGRDSTIERGDIVVTEERAKQMSQPRQTQGPASRAQRPGTAAPGSPAPATAAPTAADNPAGPEGAKRPVRTVGPTFIPAQ